MNRKKLGVMGGAILVLLSMLVVGCKQSVDSGDPNWTTDEKDKKVWERDNSSDQYVRAFKQFGTSFGVTGSENKPILAKIELADVTTGKAGFVFGLNEYGDTGNYRYFIVGLGGNGYENKVGEYYIAYYSDVDISSLSASSSAEKASGNLTTIKDNTAFSNASGITGTSGSWYVSVEEKTESDRTSVTVKIGTTLSDDQKTISSPFVTEKFVLGSTSDKDALKRVTSIKGGIGAYGMIKPGKGTALKAKDTFEVLQFSGAVALATEDAE